MNLHKKLGVIFLALTCSNFVAPATHAAEEKVLNIYNWVDYIGDDTIANFEKETGIKVNYQTYEDNATLDAALHNKKLNFDVVVPSSDWAKGQIDTGLLQKLNKSKLPNLANLDPDILNKFKDTDPNREYLAGYLWGYTTIGVNVDKVMKALGKTPLPNNFWDLVFNPTYTSKLKSCGIRMLDSPTDILPIALQYIGKPAYSNNPADYAEATAMLKKVRKDIKEFTSVDQAKQFEEGTVCVAIGWGGDFYKARRASKDKGDNFNIVPIFPKKGGLLFLDSMAIPANAKHPSNAHIFINYMLEAKQHAKLSTDTKYANPNKASLKFMDRLMANDRALFLSANDFATLTAPMPINDSLRAVRESAFQEFKAFK